MNLKLQKDLKNASTIPYEVIKKYEKNIKNPNTPYTPYSN